MTAETSLAIVFYLASVLLTFAFYDARARRHRAFRPLLTRTIVSVGWPLYLAFLTGALAWLLVRSLFRKKVVWDVPREDVLTFGDVRIDPNGETTVTYRFEESLVLCMLLVPPELGMAVIAETWRVDDCDLLVGAVPLALLGPVVYGFPMNHMMKKGQCMRLALRNHSAVPVEFELKAKVYRGSFKARAA